MSPASQRGDRVDLEPESAIIIISPRGDLILNVHDDSREEVFSYRVEAGCLRPASHYFANLLHPSKFWEGVSIANKLEDLLELYGTIEDVDTKLLPRVDILDIGSISNVTTIRNIAADFFRALHGMDLSTPSPPVVNIANLAIVADRFNAVQAFARFVRRKRYLQTIDGKTRNGMRADLPEERIRQKLLIGVMLDYPAWITLYSKRLIVRSSSRWRPEAPPDYDSALWWDLPQGVEEELMFRRECVLETIQSLQSHFLKLYTSGERQCKLGYDTSASCDSFQLGEMVKFFTRLDNIRLCGTIYGSDLIPPYLGDIDRLIESLRQCPTYQIDGNHAHCGLRTRLIPLLDLIQSHLSMDAGSLGVGLCGECWQKRREEYCWYNANRPVLWTKPNFRLTGRAPAGQCMTRHTVVRDMFMATQRDWTANGG
ncbi:hypothetical protein K402DRAFT_354886 [Aulographum hederae CBS 113979]|uniref:BTB domain-containing protein n=1 Tax=Aulographum hederae CBS 113979 TaxID=1176131 RepID=A0A6G1H0T8_9PEZI|nr:hypothetical protein K402DRAFT_354886 [Aulographum hederae CBS 113979]